MQYSSERNGLDTLKVELVDDGFKIWVTLFLFLSVYIKNVFQDLPFQHALLYLQNMIFHYCYNIKI